MRRRPDEDDQEQHEGFEADAARGRGPADHRRYGAGSAANDDVLRRRALEPHRIDENVEADGEREQRSGDPIGHQPEAEHRAQRQHHAERARFLRAHQSARDRARGGARHLRVDIGVVPHIERAGGAGAGGDADQRGDGEHRMHRARRRDEADESGEHHEEHHSRLHQRDVVGDVAAGLGFDRSGPYRICDVSHAHSLDCREARGFPSLQASVYLTRGSVSQVWNGGGEGSVHSSVVAPTPQGLAGACTLRAN